MISERIVDFHTIQISLFKQKMKRLGFLYTFFKFDDSQYECGCLFFILLYNIIPITLHSN